MTGHFYRPATTIVLSDNNKHTFVLEAYCLDFEKENASEGSSFSIGPVDERALTVARRSKVRGNSVPAVQTTLWLDRGATEHEIRERFSVSQTEMVAARGVVNEINGRYLSTEHASGRPHIDPNVLAKSPEETFAIETVAEPPPLFRGLQPPNFRSGPNILAISDECAPDAITIKQVAFTRGGLGQLSIEFSLRNRLREDVKDVRYQLVYRGSTGEVIGVENHGYALANPIPAGLAKRYSTSVSESTYRRLPFDKVSGVGFRLLDCRVAR